MATATQIPMETMAISFPTVDMKRLKGIAKAMGWSIEKLNYYDSPQFYRELDEAEKSIANGEGTLISSKEELDALFV